MSLTTDLVAGTAMPPGIYFGMSAEQYHADPALGSTSLKQIVLDPYDWQFDRLHGEEKEPTDALIFGSAWHARVLEGIPALEAKFCIEFDEAQYPKALRTVDDLKKWLERYGQRGLSAMTKPKLIAEVLQIDPDAEIMDVLKEEYRAANANKQALPPKRWVQIEAAAQWAQRHPMLSAVMENGTFSQGAPEVSIFHVDRGVRLKCRFDRLLSHAIIDMKSFAPMFNGRMRKQVITAISRNRYDLQAADYMNGWQAGKELHARGLVYGDEPFKGFLDECFNREAPKWIWIFTKTKSAPQSAVVPWMAKNAMGAAEAEISAAIDRVVELRQRYGDDADWIPTEGGFEIEDTDLPAHFGRD